MRQKIETCLKTLTLREREIIRLRYGLVDGYTYTLEEVGRIFSVTRERVRQIEAKAVKKLQHPVRSQQLEGFVKHLPTVELAAAPVAGNPEEELLAFSQLALRESPSAMEADSNETDEIEVGVMPWEQGELRFG